MQRIRKTYRSKEIHRIEKMFQTEKYKLNLIEPTDPFLPDGLNENTQKMENAMTAHEENIESRLTVLEGHKFAYGTYSGDDQGAYQFIPSPFTPKVVFANSGAPGNYNDALMTVGHDSEYLRLTENGFIVHYEMNYGIFSFIAFG